MYRQIQTTSTKCQYQAAASNPKWCPVEKCWIDVRNKQIIRNDVPINTWAPWNPVATKKVDPKTLSEIVNGAVIYSPAWRIVKYAPSMIVSTKAWVVFIRLPSISLWCAHVTVTPDASSTAVLSSGILNGFSGVTPVGGHAQPISGLGSRLLWKNAQKNAMKKQTSDRINSNIPYRKPLAT